jgi:hypothetical protein
MSMESHHPICKHPVTFSGDECFESKLYEGGFVFDLYHLKGRNSRSLCFEFLPYFFLNRINFLREPSTFFFSYVELYR